METAHNVLGDMTLDGWQINLHQSLGGIPGPLLKAMALRKLAETQKGWNYRDANKD
jgi:hypothetical protein